MGHNPVLLVDDEPSMRLLTRLLLEEQGLECEEAPSGPEALARCEPGRYAAIVLDQRMPEMTGLEVATALRGRGDGTPIVLYTGWSAPETSDAAGPLDLQVVSKTETEQLVSRIVELVLGESGPVLH
jgi:CheY-like chemotaxis protein